MDISYISLALSFLLLIIPIVLIRLTGLKLMRQLLISILRMVIQLAMIGLVLEFLFTKGSVWTTLGWFLVMIGSAVYITYERLDMPFRFLFPIIAMPLMVSSLVVMPYLALLVLPVNPFWEPKVLIPIFGMILGNCMNGTALAVDRFTSDIKSNQNAYRTWIAMGATRCEAVLPFFRKAMKMALMPR
ncbi:MAG: ABC transporter permease [Candidatus Cloacimonetes bacterium]|nr:ABC transporter permease [Candidatus Cloacimonadota bacterium]